MVILFILFCTPLFNRTLVSLDRSSVSGHILDLEGPVTSGIRDYFIIGITATNTESRQYPSLTADIKWKSPGTEDFKAVQGQKFKIFVDGISHDYYIPVGENKYWTAALSEMDKPEVFDDITVELPQIEGIDISVDRVELKNRTFFPADIYFNLQVKRILEIQPSFLVNRFLAPSYILLAIILIMAVVFQLLFRSYPGQGTAGKGRNTAISGRVVIIASAAMLVFFSFYFLSIQAFTLKSYWDSYKKDIQSGDLDKTYLGYYDFEKFISWLGDEIPGNENIIVLVRGEPIYIMSEMAYNLYPKDIKFINISKKEGPVIFEEIMGISGTEISDYSYVVALSSEDTAKIPGLTLIGKYTGDGGLIYTFK